MQPGPKCLKWRSKEKTNTDLAPNLIYLIYNVDRMADKAVVPSINARCSR